MNRLNTTLNEEEETAYFTIDPESMPQAECVLFAFFSHIHMLIDTISHLRHITVRQTSVALCAYYHNTLKSFVAFHHHHSAAPLHLFLTFQVTVRWFSPLLLGLMIRSPWSKVSIIFSAWLKLMLWKLGWAITRFMYAGE